jgi:hypothetical protein
LKLPSQILRRQFFYRSLANLGLARGQNNLSAAFSELTGNLETDAPISPGHNDDGCACHIIL